MDRTEAAVILGVAPESNEATVRKAFRRKAVKSHPDIPGNDPKVFAEYRQALGVMLGEYAPKPTTTRAMELMVQAFSTALSSSDVEYDDIVNKADVVLQQDASKIEATIRDFRTEHKLISTMLSKLKCSGDNDPIRHKFTAHLLNVEQAILANEVLLADTGTARRLLKSYSYECSVSSGIYYVGTSTGTVVW